jgi:SulP family sulfate permease
VTGSNGGYDWQTWSWIPALSALVTFMAISFGPRFIPKLPGTISGLIVGSMAFHILTLIGPQEIPDNWLIGQIPGLDSINFNYSLESLSNFPW